MDEFDVIVIGSGAAGLTAALTAALSGASCLVLEHLDRFGGTSARSSGSVWVPDNPWMRAAGLAGDRAAAEAYLDGLVGDLAPREKRIRFLDAGPRMLADLAARAGLGFEPITGSADYRQDVEGAAPGSRALAPTAFDGRRLGDLFPALADPIPELTILGGMMVTRPEAAMLLRADRSLDAFAPGARLVARHARDRLAHHRGTRLVLGNALVARLLDACRARGVTLTRGAETTELTKTAGRVTGVLLKDGRRIAARRAVVLAGGGFPASAEWRAAHLPKPVAQHTPASPGAAGATVRLGLDAGAALGPDGIDNALWFPSSLATRADGSTAVYPHIVLDRAKPGSLIVDGAGKRFANEAVSYHEFVRAMYRAGPGAFPAWLIADSRFVKRYGIGLIRPRALSLRAHIRSGYLKTAPTIAGLAGEISAPPDALTATVARLNGFARTGRDEDFGRGETIYDRGNGDPAHGPNPCLGEVAAPPFHAVALHPTPLGTSRGIETDVEARALTADGAPVPGLYVCGNDMQSVFGGEYPGAGAQLGQAMTFGWIAARHALGAND